MIAMQYNIKLPSDYNMDIIKKRVKDNGFKTDGFKGLEMKSYLIAEKGKHRNIENEYAPFYLWSQIEGMNKFLLEGPFHNILNSFGWTSVNTWQVIHATVKKHKDIQYAIVNKTKIMPRDDFGVLFDRQKKNFELWKDSKWLSSCIISYNPTTWELCTFLQSNHLEMINEVTDGGLIYESYHVS
ncbi:MAG: DUF4865 family protein [Lachnospiraceae bacterium]|nr:DUF4865 family protein [Lachnospiraceae bacterium]